MIIKRILWIVPMLLVVSFLMFCLELLLPGDPAVTLAGPAAGPQRIEELRQHLGLDRPVVERYVDWLGNAVQGDLGRSLMSRRAVTTELASRWSVTAALVVGSVGVSLLVGVPAGIMAGRNRRGWIDRATTVGATLGVAFPHFLIGIFLVILLSVWLGLLPVAGYVPIERGGFVEWVRHLVIPVVALSGVMTAEVTRQLRSALSDTLEQDYIRTARAKGLHERVVVVKHGLRIAASPAISVVSVQVARLLGGAVLVEQVFSLPGMGQLTALAILNRDLPVIQGLVPFAVLVAVGTNVLADSAQTMLDPRVRAGVRG